MQIGFNKDAKAAEESVEKQILEHLASTLYTMLSNYRTTVDQDIETIESSTNPREVVAAKLVKIEKEILTGALDEILADPLAPGWIKLPQYLADLVVTCCPHGNSTHPSQSCLCICANELGVFAILL